MDKMKTYFCLIRTLQPKLSDEGNQVLLRYYQMQRQSDSRNAARTTIRLLESLIRLAEAHARLMFRDTVTLEDAVTVVSVMESSMQGGALLGGVNALHTSFPENPLEQYQRQCELILEKLELHNLLSEELTRLQRLQNQNLTQSQQQVGEGECTPEFMSSDPVEKPTFRASTPQEMNCGLHISSPGGSPRESLLLDPPSNQVLNRSNGKHSAEHKINQENGLDWFDTIVAHQIKTKNTVAASPTPKPTAGEMALKISSTFQGKKKNEPDQTEQLPAPEEKETPWRPDDAEGQQVAVVSADEPGSVMTHHVPRKLHKLHKEGTQKWCRSTTTAPSGFTSSSPGPISEKRLKTPKRKSQKSLAPAEVPELESLENEDPPLAKLAKFTFRQKSKLIHSPEDHCFESSGTIERAGENPTLSGTGGEAILPGKGSGKLRSNLGNSSDQLLCSAKEVPQQPPEKHGLREKEYAPKKRLTQPELELQHETEHFHLPSERDGKEITCSNKSSKVHACTLAKLANFSFTSPSESNKQPTSPKSKNWSERDPNPPTASAPIVANKRKSFQLGGSPEKSNLSKKYLFSLSELDDETLDFDWEEEMRKKS